MAPLQPVMRCSRRMMAVCAGCRGGGRPAYLTQRCLSTTNVRCAQSDRGESPDIFRDLQQAADEAVKSVSRLVPPPETIIDSGRENVNKLLKPFLGLEVRKAPRTGQKQFTQGSSKRTPGKADMPLDSHFWEPYREDSPWVNREKYLAQFERFRNGQGCAPGACDIVSEEEIRVYVEELVDSGSLSGFAGFSHMFAPRILYMNVVKVCLLTIQTAVGCIDGQTVLGRELFLLKRDSYLSRLRVSQKYTVNQEIVNKLVTRVMADHAGAGRKNYNFLGGEELQRQIYTDTVTLVFRLVFDLADGCQLRVLGHTVKIDIEVDDRLAEAPGWNMPLDGGAFGRFDDEALKKFVSDFVDTILQDESINMPHVPDVLEKPVYENVVMLLFELVETACNHLRLHLAGISFRPHLGDDSGERA